MAGDAAVGLEQLVATLLLGPDGIAFAAQIAIERRPGRDQGTLEGGQRIENEWPRRRSGHRCSVERVPVRLIRAQLRKQCRPARAHQPRVEQHRLGLLLQRAKIATPVEPEAQGRIEDRGRVEVERPAIGADRPRLTIVPALVKLVAGGAGEPVVTRQPDIAKQPLAETQPWRGPDGATVGMGVIGSRPCPRVMTQLLGGSRQHRRR